MNISSPKQYEQGGVFFSFPGNWSVTEDRAVENLRYIFVESRGSALLIFQFYGMDQDMQLMDYARSFSELAKQDIPPGSFGPSTFTQESENGVEERYTVSIQGRETTHAREYSKRTRDDAVCFLIFQVVEEDLDNARKGFDVVAESFEFRGRKGATD